jgi:ribonuclease Z
MKVVFLGTGGSWPTKYRNVLSIGMHFGSEVILFDCGEGTQRQMMRSTLSFMKIKRIFITHFHADHFLGLPGMFQTMNLNDRTEDLHIYGPKGISVLVNELTHLGYFKPRYRIIAHDLEPGDTVEGEGYTVKAVEVCHNVPAYGYVFQENDRPGKFNKPKALELGIPEGPLFRRLQQGQSVDVNGKTFTPDMVMGPPRKGIKISYSGDTAPCASFEEASRNADLMIHEATGDYSLKEKTDEYGHSTAKEAAELAKRANVRMLALVHTSPRYEEPDIILKEAKEVFPETIVPWDLEEIELKYRD